MPAYANVRDGEVHMQLTIAYNFFMTLKSNKRREVLFG